MPRPTRNFGNHSVIWSPETNQIIIKPQYPNSTTTEPFGLGNGVIQLNLSNLPEKITVPITDETTGQGIVPTSPFGLSRWYAMPENIRSRTKVLTGFNGWTAKITYREAERGSVKQVVSAPIIQNGYGCEEIVGNALRLYW